MHRKTQALWHSGELDKVTINDKDKKKKKKKRVSTVFKQERSLGLALHRQSS
jgi:hypothetical protein